MIIYQCSFCKYQTDKPTNFEKHMNKTNNCATHPPSKNTPSSKHKFTKNDNLFTCLGCQKTFQHYSSINRHILHRCVAFKKSI